MYKANNYNGTIYEKIFNTMALDNFIVFLSNITESEKLYGLWNELWINSESKLELILSELDKNKEITLKNIERFKIYPNYLTPENAFELYKQTIDFLYSNNFSIPNVEIEYCIAKILIEEGNILELYFEGSISTTEEIIDIFNNYGLSDNELEDFKKFMDDKMQKILASNKDMTKEKAFEEIARMFIGRTLINKCFYNFDYEFIDNNLKHQTLDDIIDNNKLKSKEQQKNNTYINNENTK